MWKIVVVLLLTALAILAARLAYDAPVIRTRVGTNGPYPGSNEIVSSSAIPKSWPNRHVGVDVLVSTS